MTLEATLERIAVALEKIADRPVAIPPIMGFAGTAVAGLAPAEQPAPAATTRTRKPRQDKEAEATPAAEAPVMTGAEAEKALDGHLNQAPAAEPAAAEPAPADVAPATEAAPADAEAAPAPQAEAVTYKDVQDAAYAFSNAGYDRAAAIALLGEFNCGMLKQLKESDFAAAVKRFKEETAKKAGA